MTDTWTDAIGCDEQAAELPAPYALTGATTTHNFTGTEWTV